MVLISTPPQANAVIFPERPGAQLSAAEELLLGLLPKKKDLERLDLPGALIKSLVNEDGLRVISVHRAIGDGFSEFPERVCKVPVDAGFSFRGSNLKYCRFEGDCNFDFRFCNLEGADFSKARLQGAKFQQPFNQPSNEKIPTLRDIAWPESTAEAKTGATIFGPNFFDVPLAIFSEIVSDVKGLRLEKLDLGGLDLRKVNLQGATVDRCNLHDAILPNDLTGTSFFLDSMEGVNLTGSLLRDSFICCDQILANSLPKKLGNVALSGNISGQDFSNYDLRGADLSRVRELDFTKTKMPEDLSSVVFPNYLTDVDLSNKVINGAVFNFVTRVKLPNNVGGATFHRAVFLETDMRGVDFQSGNFDQATFRNCDVPHETPGYSKKISKDGLVELSGLNHNTYRANVEQLFTRKSVKEPDTVSIDIEQIPLALQALLKGVNHGEVVEMILPRKSNPPHIHVYLMTRIENSSDILLLQIDREIEQRGEFFAALFKVDGNIKFDRMIDNVGGTEEVDNFYIKCLKTELGKIIFGNNKGFGNTSIKFGDRKRIITTAGTSGLVGESAENSENKGKFLYNISQAREILKKPAS